MVKTLNKWTVEEYHCLIETGLLAGRQVELLDGKIINMTPELPIHRVTYRRGVKYLEKLLGAAKGTRSRDRAVVFATSPIILPSNGEPQPDICVAIPPESRYDNRHPTPQDIYWLIEVSNSTLSYDLNEKAHFYARDSIQEYWVIDIPHCKLWVHRQPIDGKYQSVWQLSSGKITLLSFPDVEIWVETLLR